MFAHRFTDEKTYQVVEHCAGFDRVIPKDQHDYLAWCKTNTPKVEAEGRFLSVVDGKLVVAKDKEAVLAAEEAARLAEIARQEAREQAMIDNLPSWTEVDAAITAISDLASAKAFIRKHAFVTYWLAKGKAE
jgi:hypothetical protein